MKLINYLEQTDITAKKLAQSVGITPSALSNYIQGIRKPRPDIANNIVDATRGRVTLKDLYPKEGKS